MTTEGNDWASNVRQINLLTMELEKQFKQIADADRVEETCTALAEVHLIKQSVSIVYDSVCKMATTAMGSVTEVTLPDGTKIEKRAGSERKKWQHEELAKHIASRLNDMSIDMSTGEIVMSPQDMVVKLLDYCAPSYWRVKELAKIGISADKFCDVEFKDENVIVRRGK